MLFFDYLPCIMLHRSPRIIAAYETDFLKNLPAFQKAIPQGENFTLFLQLGWTAEIPEISTMLKTKLAEARSAFPEARFIILANTQKEVDIIKEFCEVYFVHQNIFLNPARYPLASKNAKRKYDAIYIARITPFKRHILAEKVKHLRLIGWYSEQEKEYFDETMARLPDAQWTLKVPSFLIGRKICEAACGLALSAMEGGMFVCGEYSLCGLPVVSTHNLGGRDVLLPQFSVRYADDTAESVAENVEYWLKNPLDPAEIRQAFLELAQPQKVFFQDLVNSIAGTRVRLPAHKLNVRCHLLPHVKLLHGIRKVN